MIDYLLEPFSYNYMTNAMWVSALVGSVCAFLSAYLMLKGWSLIGDALSHSVIPGVAGAYMLGLPFALGAFISGGIAAGAMLFLTGRSGLKTDVVIGLIFTSFFGVGLFMISVSPVSIDVMSITMGNILAITPEDTFQLILIGATSLAILSAKWKDLMVTFFDENHARSIGLRPDLLKLVFFVLLSASVVAAMKTVGAFLVIALVITPGATAYLLCDRFPRLILMSIAIGAFTSFFGAYISYFLDGATGGVIVTLQTLLFLVVFVFAPKHGLLAAKSRSADALKRTPKSINGADKSAGVFLMEFDIANALLPFRFPFMQNAFLIAVMVSIPTAILSCFLVLKGWALMGDAISHSILPGIVLAHIFGIPLLLGAFAAGMFTAVATGYLAGNSRVKQDTIMGIVFSGMFGIGIVMFVAIKPETHLDHILFGNMLGVETHELWQSGLISLAVATILILKWKDWLLHSFDPAQAKASGLKVGLLHYGLLAIVSLTVVATLAATGLILAIGLLIAPGAIAFLIVRKFSDMLWVSVFVCMGSMLIGVYASFFLDSAPAPTIVLFMTGLFILAFIRKQYLNRRAESVAKLQNPNTIG